MASSSRLKRQMSSTDTLENSEKIEVSLPVPHSDMFSTVSTPWYDTPEIKFTAGQSIGTLANFGFDVRAVTTVGDSRGDGRVDCGILMTLKETLRADWASHTTTFPEKLYFSMQIDIIDETGVVKSFPTKYITFCSHNHIWTKHIKEVPLADLTKGFVKKENGNVIFKISLTLYKDEDGKKLKKDLKDKLDRDIAMGLETGLGADLTIRVPLAFGGLQYAETKVNKGILSMRSAIFASMFSNGTHNNDNGVITIECLTQKGLEILLKYIYTSEISEEWTQVAVELLNAAKKYQLTELGSFLSQNFTSAITVENAEIFYAHAAKLKMKEIEKEIVKFTEKNAKQLLQKLTK